MSDLFKVADAAYPQDDWSFLPADIRALGGYVGGDTPHDWTRAEVAHFEATGRPWWGIWTAEGSKRLTPADAVNDAHAMAAGLAALGRPKIMPAFWDVEHSTYQAGPAQADAAGALWCQTMRELGYPHVGWYGPCYSAATWRACWGIDTPTSIPTGQVGIQFENALAGDRYDLSIFSASALGIDPAGVPIVNGGSEVLDPNDPVVRSLLSGMDTLVGQVHDIDYGYVDQTATPFVSRGEMVDRIRSIHANVVATAAKVNALGAGGQIDVAQLAADLEAILTPDLLRSLGQALLAKAGT